MSLPTLPRWGSMRSGVCSERPTLGRRTGGSDSSSSPEGWQIPTQLDAAGRTYTYPSGDKTRPFDTLCGEARKWSTPTSRDWKDGNNPSEAVDTNSLLGRQAPRMMGSGPEFSPPARTSRRLWPTAQVALKGHSPASYERQRKRKTAEGIHLQADLQVEARRMTGHRRLNPRFVEWLMGFPLGWTACAPSATLSSPPRLNSRSERCGGD